ncbi:MAG TPA: virulence RhuM family protein [Verrucomicrobiota bacterium]|nr:virulence RhuM family protein [Verrucomicrobiota bacterium]HNT14890.1 virulence RhuM family protein [Verrucomicrobiota bacterium]
MKQPTPPPGGEIILYQTEDKQTRLRVQLDGETVWLSQAQMAELFQTTKQNVSLHIRNIFTEGELREPSVVKESLTTAADGKSYATQFYNLDVIISVGYRVKSHRGTQFRIWATQRLREYIIKGFALDDARLKEGKSAYFDELLARIRDIRSSEKEFWRKVLDLYATSADYDPSAEASQRFFATVQNKMHWGAHGHTAAEIIHARADATKPNMGLTAWLGSRPRKTDALVAKNYLTVDEIEALNLIVSLYLDFAELQAKSRKLMTMRDWIAKLDDFLRLSDRQILTHAGKVSHEVAAAKAGAEYGKFRVLEDARPSAVEKDFEEAVKKLKPPATKRKKP